MNFYLNEPFLQLALKNGNIVQIEDVDNGKKCNCICPKCNRPLIAKNEGKIKIHHFAHAADSDCIGAIESALHLLSKEILKETKTIFIPDYRFYYSDLKIDSILFNYNKQLTFDSVKLEEKIQVGNEIIIADALCEINGKQMIVEFAKSHFIDDNKRKKLIALGIASIEIPISLGEQNRKALTTQLHSNFFKTAWVVNKKGEALIESTKIKLLEEIEEVRKKAKAEHERREKISEQEAHEREQEAIINNKVIKERLLREEAIKKTKLVEAATRGNLIENCPIRNEFIEEFNTRFNDSNNIVPRLFAAKEISPIYDHSPEYVDIFIDKERVVMIPPGYHRMGVAERIKWDLLYKTVTTFLKFRHDRNFNPPIWPECSRFKIQVSLN